jgi:hypothetical protein
MPRRKASVLLELRLTQIAALADQIGDPESAGGAPK